MKTGNEEERERIKEEPTKENQRKVQVIRKQVDIGQTTSWLLKNYIYKNQDIIK